MFVLYDMTTMSWIKKKAVLYSETFYSAKDSIRLLYCYVLSMRNSRGQSRTVFHAINQTLHGGQK
jgi:hypothetical protein